MNSYNLGAMSGTYTTGVGGYNKTVAPRKATEDTQNTVHKKPTSQREALEANAIGATVSVGGGYFLWELVDAAGHSEKWYQPQLDWKTTGLRTLAFGLAAALGSLAYHAIKSWTGNNTHKPNTTLPKKAQEQEPQWQPLKYLSA